MMSDLPGLILDTISYYTHSNHPVAHTLAQGVLELANTRIDIGSDSDQVADLYKNILKAQIEDDYNLRDPADLSQVLLKQKAHPAVVEDPGLLRGLENIITSSTSATTVRLNNQERRIRNSLLWGNMDNFLKQINKKKWKCDTSSDESLQDLLLTEIREHAKDLVRAYETTAGRMKEPIEEINMTDPESIQKAINQHRQRKSKGNRLKTGLQGLNEMLEGGIVRGELCGIGALTHHGKSKLLMDFARWFCIHNSPGTPPGVIPTIVFISLENELFENAMEWHRAAYADIYHEEPGEMSDEEILTSLTEVYSKRGFNMLVYRRTSDFFGMDEFRQLQDELQKDGFYVVATIIDYMQLMKISEVNGLNRAQAMQRLFHDMADFAKQTGQAVVTGLQLTKEAEMIANSGVTYVAKRFHGGLIADCTAIKRELDCLIFQHIEKDPAGVPHLTWSWDKRRYHKPPKTLYCGYPFEEFGILDDLHGENRAVYDIYEGNSRKNKVPSDEPVAVVNTTSNAGPIEVF